MRRQLGELVAFLQHLAAKRRHARRAQAKRQLLEKVGARDRMRKPAPLEMSDAELRAVRHCQSLDDLEEL